MAVEALRLMATRGVAWVPTAGTLENDPLEMAKLLDQNDLKAERRARIEEWLPPIRVGSIPASDDP